MELEGAPNALPSGDPYNAPLWRKLLALRVIALCIIGAVISVYLIDWIDKPTVTWPKWIRTVGGVILALPFLMVFMSIKEGLADLAIHFFPEGRVRQSLLWGDEKRTATQIASDFEKIGYAMPVIPLILPAIIFGIALAAGLVIGGGVVVASLLGGLFSGWPTWAVVITFLLIAILLKK
jgi:hypothetical protein